MLKKKITIHIIITEELEFRTFQKSLFFCLKIDFNTIFCKLNKRLFELNVLN